MSEQLTPAGKAAAEAEITAAMLSLGRTLERGSLLLTAVALLALIIGPLALLARQGLFLAVLAGLCSHWFALRTAFDQPLFAAWARRWWEPGADIAADLRAFDAALAASGLRPDTAGPSRPLAARIAGARGLLRRQGFCCAFQVLGCLVAVLAITFIP